MIHYRYIRMNNGPGNGEFHELAGLLSDVDGEMNDRIDGAHDRQKHCNANNLAGMAGAIIDYGNDRLLQHA